MLIERLAENKYKLTRQHWWEWLYVPISKEVAESYMIPRFYLVVGRSDWMSLTYRAYLFPIAPFVLAWRIFSRMVRSLWYDLVEFSDVLQLSAKNVKEKN